jgi:8-oxo-dGTP pyrophosphatase MutT (NUDIX family)
LLGYGRRSRRTGETSEQALIREAPEKGGLTPLNLTFVERLIGHAPNLPECANDILVVRKWTGGEPVMLDDEHTELR